MKTAIPLSRHTGSSVTVKVCQVCESPDLKSIFFLGYLPPASQMHEIGQRPHEQLEYPAELLLCDRCKLAQLGLIVDPNIIFPPEFPYTSGTTKILRDNFAELFSECRGMFPFSPKDFVIDIGSNDGTLLMNFKNAGHRVLGIEPTLMANLAERQGIPSIMAFFDREVAKKVKSQHGLASIVTATNVFAHIENIHDIVDDIVSMLSEKGIFISESHYFLSFVETLQYDCIYHEHLRFYTLESLKYLLNLHGLEIIFAKRIPTHGGSMRVYSAPKGVHKVNPEVQRLLDLETSAGLTSANLNNFKERAVRSKLQLHSILLDVKRKRERVFGIGAPARAGTLIHYIGLDDGILDCVLEIKGSHKIGKYMPGTLIPVREESVLFTEQPEYALLLSWHIADELIPKLRQKGFKGKFIVPLPEPRVISG